LADYFRGFLEQIGFSNRLFLGNPYHDLARFMTFCADAEVRRECEEKAVDKHYDTFCDMSKKLGSEVKFTREQVINR
jgi:hypothetical protein